MKRDLAAAHAPKVDQNLYYGMYYRFLDYSLLFIRALSRICRGFTLYLPFFHHVSKLLKMWTFHSTIRQSRHMFAMIWTIWIVLLWLFRSDGDRIDDSVMEVEDTNANYGHLDENWCALLYYIYRLRIGIKLYVI